MEKPPPTITHSALLRWLPAVLLRSIERHPRLSRILDNIIWLFFDRFLRLGVGLLVVIWVARYLGPEQFGLMNYAAALVALLSVIATFGFNAIVVRDLVTAPEQAYVTLGTAFLLQFIGGLLVFGLATLAISWVRPEDAQARLIVAVLSFATVFKATEVVKYWFESIVQSKYAVWVENGVFLLFALVKIALVVNHAPLMAFVWATAGEGFVVGCGLLVVYIWRGGALWCWQCSYQRVKSLLTDGFPLALSGVAVMIYMRIDQVMLGQMLGDEAVGIYSAAVRISEVWYFVPGILVSSTFPLLLAEKSVNQQRYYQRLQQLFYLVTVISLGMGVFMSIVATELVVLLYGEHFAQAGSVLVINIWAGLFVSLGLASGQWYLMENMSASLFYRTFSGAVANVLLNLLLIPVYGIHGAAIATLFSQLIAGFLYDLLDKKSRILFFMKLKALFLQGICRSC
jgi:PST family polysaccharide transporter